ncbi:Uncharacterised protein r2_g49 [Pycnogonum litorale]
MLVWIENAPKLNVDSDDIVIEFIDRYISCDLPSSEEDPELFNIVNEVQTHSRRDSKTCKKKNAVCRFNFPRQPSKKTFICRPSVDSNENEDSEIMLEDDAKSLVKKINEADDGRYTSVNDIFNGNGISQQLYEKALATLSKNTNIFMKRDLNSRWINHYNRDLLRIWNHANMDIQYVTDPYSCIVYIVSYISKSEKKWDCYYTKLKMKL